MPRVVPEPVVDEGKGIFSFIVDEDSGYYLGPGTEMFAHRTGPPLSTNEGLEFKRSVLVFGTHIRGQPMDSENALLEKTTFRSEFNHYKKTGSGIEYDNTEPQPDDRVDTMFTQIPDIPHGSLSAKALEPLQRLKRMIKKNGTMVFTSMSKANTRVSRST